MKTVIAIFFVLALCSFASAENVPEFDTLDKNRDGMITLDELDGSNLYLKQFDLDNNGILDRDELKRGIMSNLDVDMNGMIDRKEWDNGASQFQYKGWNNSSPTPYRNDLNENSPSIYQKRF